MWAPDPSFDPDRHIEGADPSRRAPTSSDWAANRIVRPLPLDRPLWRAEVVDGLPGQRFALIVVVHHVAADGLAGVALAGSLLDRPPDATVPDDAGPARHRRCRRTATCSGDRLRGLAAALRRARPLSGAGVRRLRDLAGSSATPPPTCAPARRRRRCRGRSGRRAGWPSSGNRWTSCGGPATRWGSP